MPELWRGMLQGLIYRVGADRQVYYLGGDGWLRASESRTVDVLLHWALKCDVGSTERDDLRKTVLDWSNR